MVAMRQIELDGLTFHYSLAGRGTPLLLLHGGGSRANHFSALVEHLASSFTVATYDMRGFGATGIRPGIPFDHQTWCDDVGRMLDHLGWDRAAIGGWSLGATIALNFASQHPTRVSALALMGAPHPDRPIDRAYFHRRLTLVRAGATAAEVVAETFPVVAAMFSPATLARRPAALETVRQEQLANRVEWVAPLVAAYESRPAFGPILERIACPVAVLAGDADAGGLRGAEGLRARLARCQVELIAECGHYYAVEQPQAVAEAVTRALRCAGVG